jgi:chromatin structure-remodeling complex subunit RSC1/2
MSEKDRKKLSTKLGHQLAGIYELKDADGLPVADTFQRLPLRKLVDYYKIIKNPVSLHGVGRMLKNLRYTDAQEFVTDLAQMVWNAKLYNVKGLVIYDHAAILERYVRDMIGRLNKEGVGRVFYPDLGPLPEGDEGAHAAQAAPGALGAAGGLNGGVGAAGGGGHVTRSHFDFGTPPAYGQPPAHGATGRGPGRPPGGSISPPAALLAGPTSGIRRGRPPIIDKPYETRIKLILKQFKKLRLPGDPNYALTSKFDRLPDPKYNSAYYATVKQPILLFEIRTKVRTRKYHTVDEFINDITLMFENTKFFYGGGQAGPAGAQVLHECLVFEAEATKIIRQELLKPEKELLTANTPGGDGIIRIPLDLIEIEGYLYHIGDWVLIKNDNDATRPTVGQIFRLWATEDGTKYTNVCWYYRPEQTCHRVDRLFFSNEVCKTGQYRDHLALEIVGPCYVVFLTRYQKGDLPEGVIPPGCPWFICEFRYNENLHVFNRIRTWKACLPDEIRDKQEQPLVPLHEPRKLIKYELPIRAMLPGGVDLHMQILEATLGANPNTPPIVGLVYLRTGAEDDELGQYLSLPNVVRLPEHDVDGRAAYLFTPPLQMKLSASIFPPHQSSHYKLGAGSGSSAAAASFSPGGLYLAPNQLFRGAMGTPVSLSGEVGSGGGSPMAASPAAAQAYPKTSYAASMNIYRQHLQQQQQQQQQYLQPVYGREGKRALTPTAQAAALAPGVSSFNSAVTSIYLAPIVGGVLAYTTLDENNALSKVSEGINHKKRKVVREKAAPISRQLRELVYEEELDNTDSDLESDDEDELEDNAVSEGLVSKDNEYTTEIVWYRAPPIVVANRLVTRNGVELGHSAAYLAWRGKLAA